MTDFLMSNEDFLRKGLLPATQPGFGWYQIRVGWITPQEDIEPRQKKDGSGTYVKFSLRLDPQQRAIFTPDPERTDYALFDSAEKLRGRGFFTDFFLGGNKMKDAARAFGTQFTYDKSTGPTPLDIHNTYSGPHEAWVKIFHGTNFRDEPECVVARWSKEAPLTTFVHAEEREAFLGQ